jgi:hypothetical protein
MNFKRSALGALSVAALVGSSLAIAATTASGDPAANVTICHRTNSVSNPYTMPTVDESAVDGDTGNDNGQGDHTTHTGPVFDFNNPPPPPHNGDQWGDIIPPFDENGNPRPEGAPTLNWNAAGQAIFNNDCVPGNAAINVKKVVTGTGTPVASQTYSIELTCSLDLGSGPTQVLDETVNLTDGQTSADFEVQAGAECSAVEDTTGLANLVSATNDGPVTLAAVGDTYTITETNNFAAPLTPPTPGPSVGPEVSPTQAAVAPAVQTAPRTTG